MLIVGDSVQANASAVLSLRCDVVIHLIVVPVHLSHNIADLSHDGDHLPSTTVHLFWQTAPLSPFSVRPSFAASYPTMLWQFLTDPMVF
jgi:hypothetical protein